MGFLFSVEAERSFSSIQQLREYLIEVRLKPRRGMRDDVADDDSDYQDNSDGYRDDDMDIVTPIRPHDVLAMYAMVNLRCALSTNRRNAQAVLAIA